MTTIATLLVCLIGAPCDETTAVAVLRHVVDNELECVTGWQE